MGLSSQTECTRNQGGHLVLTVGKPPLDGHRHQANDKDSFRKPGQPGNRQKTSERNKSISTVNSQYISSHKRPFKSFFRNPEHLRTFLGPEIFETLIEMKSRTEAACAGQKQIVESDLEISWTKISLKFSKIPYNPCFYDLLVITSWLSKKAGQWSILLEDHSLWFPERLSVVLGISKYSPR